ncbi:MAG: hypothetical protein KDJ75_08925 [Alphaproteobacteria bacterium]|nr:hypothetical protein [Alphaproteobacteria bacterium]
MTRHSQRHIKHTEPVSTSSTTLPRANSGGAGNVSQNDRPARHFSHRNILGFWRAVGTHANDNAALVREHNRRVGLSYAAAALMMIGSTFGLNSSTVATQAVLHADSAVLAAAMDISPEALGYVLNHMDIGE